MQGTCIEFNFLLVFVLSSTQFQINKFFFEKLLWNISTVAEWLSPLHFEHRHMRLLTTFFLNYQAYQG